MTLKYKRIVTYTKVEPCLDILIESIDAMKAEIALSSSGIKGFILLAPKVDYVEIYKLASIMYRTIGDFLIPPYGSEDSPDALVFRGVKIISAEVGSPVMYGVTNAPF